MPPPKREPQWVRPFLAALGSCGNATRAAALAGVDVTGPYNRRARYPEFRAAWEQAIAAREARAALGAPASLDTLGIVGARGGSLDTLGTNGGGGVVPGSGALHQLRWSRIKWSTKPPAWP